MQNPAQILEALQLLDPEEHLDAKESVAQVKELLVKKYQAAVETENREKALIEENLKTFWRHQDVQLDSYIDSFKHAIKISDNKKALVELALKNVNVGLKKYATSTFDV